MIDNEIQFLNLEEVLALHEMQIERYGGATGIRDQGLLESAIGCLIRRRVRPPWFFEMAAAYAFHIAENQPFIDGNKRTALAAVTGSVGVARSVPTDPRGAKVSQHFF